LATLAKERGEDVIVMSIGESEVDTAGPVVEAAISALLQGDTHYLEVEGKETLRRAVADRQNRLFGLGITPDNVTITAGTQNALFMSASLLLDPGDEVIVADPMYVTYDATLSATGAKIVRLSCSRGNGFLPDITQLESLVTPKTKAIFFATPVNPTGVVFDTKTLEGIADIATRHDLWVVADEVYSELVYEGSHKSIVTLPGMRDRCITLGSLSKSHNMTGWRSGWAIGPKEFSQRAAAFCLNVTYGLPGFIQEAAIVALQRDVSDTKELYRKRRDIALKALNGLPDVECLRPQSGMFVLLSVEKTVMDSTTFVRKLYKQAGVCVLDAETFGKNLRGMVRINFAMQEQILRWRLSRIKKFLRVMK
jgi:aspartate/methionine/tyrosine aminotransferase